MSCTDSQNTNQAVITPIAVAGDQVGAPFPFPRPTDGLVKRARILLVDGDLQNQFAILRFLDATGFSNVHTLKPEPDVLHRIRDANPELVIFNYRSTGSCSEILSSIRNDQTLVDLPILAMTDSNDEKLRSALINQGVNDFLAKPVSGNELFARVRNTLASKVAYNRLLSKSEKLKQDVLRDPLTGTANRRAFDFELNRKMLEWTRQRTNFSLLILDIDHFKKINDTYGHQAGDHALQMVADTVQATTRAIDLVCRIGGEEFAVILPVSNRTESGRAAERIREAVADTKIVLKGKDLNLTVSVGVAYTLKGDDPSLIYRRCDAALYASKQRGRNCTSFHDGANCIPFEGVNQDKQSKPIRHGNAPEPMNVTSSKVLIVDDDPSTVVIVKKYLKNAGFERISTELDSKAAVDEIKNLKPDLVLLDIHMPDVNGMEILQEVRQTNGIASTPVVFLTSSTDADLRVRALNMGASDFLNKPVVAAELVARVRNTLLAKAHMDLLANYSSKLEHQVESRTAELIASRREAIQCLARAAELRDDITGRHVIRVGRYASIIAREFGFSPQELIDLEHAAQLHDVGKIGIPDAILNKPASLTDNEYEAMKNHCRTGSQIISGETVGKENSLSQVRSIVDECSSPVMRLAALVAETHHEKWDGTGYPHGLKGEDIPLAGRITAICDVFDAISTNRPYKAAYALDKCFDIIKDGSGTHFDPAVVDAFFKRSNEIVEAYAELSDHAFKS